MTIIDCNDYPAPLAELTQEVMDALQTLVALMGQSDLERVTVLMNQIADKHRRRTLEICLDPDGSGELRFVFGAFGALSSETLCHWSCPAVAIPTLKAYLESERA